MNQAFHLKLIQLINRNSAICFFFYSLLCPSVARRPSFIDSIRREVTPMV